MCIKLFTIAITPNFKITKKKQGTAKASPITLYRIAEALPCKLVFFSSFFFS